MTVHGDGGRWVLDPRKDENRRSPPTLVYTGPPVRSPARRGSTCESPVPPVGLGANESLGHWVDRKNLCTRGRRDVSRKSVEWDLSKRWTVRVTERLSSVGPRVERVSSPGAQVTARLASRRPLSAQDV